MAHISLKRQNVVKGAGYFVESRLGGKCQHHYSFYYACLRVACRRRAIERECLIKLPRRIFFIAIWVRCMEVTTLS